MPFVQRLELGLEVQIWKKREGRRNEVETLHKSNLPPKAAPPRSQSVAPSWSRAARCERRWLRGRSTTTTARNETKGREPRDADNAAQPNARLFALPLFLPSQKIYRSYPQRKGRFLCRFKSRVGLLEKTLKRGEDAAARSIGRPLEADRE